MEQKKRFYPPLPYNDATLIAPGGNTNRRVNASFNTMNEYPQLTQVAQIFLIGEILRHAQDMFCEICGLFLKETK